MAQNDDVDPVRCATDPQACASAILRQAADSGSYLAVSAVNYRHKPPSCPCPANDAAVLAAADVTLTATLTLTSTMTPSPTATIENLFLPPTCGDEQSVMPVAWFVKSAVIWRV